MATSNVNVIGIEPIITPKQLKQRRPMTDVVEKRIAAWRSEIADSIHGRDRRLLMIVGPCSIHDREGGLEYAKRLVACREKYKTTLNIVMRVYFEKPRTTVGWKGLINDPHMDGSNDINQGLDMARELLLQINQLGMPVACEFLDVFTPQYLADLVSWGAIGARTTESQLHRELASGLSPPIGFKNGTDGNVDIAIDAIICASSPHTFLGIDENGLSSIVKTKGNSTLHVILRGGKDGPNYYEETISRVKTSLINRSIKGRIMIDCSHGNSSKDYRNQGLVLLSVLKQIVAGEDRICGVMLESNLVEGNQRHNTATGKTGLEYGKSVTDGCISFEETGRLFAIVHETLEETFGLFASV